MINPDPKMRPNASRLVTLVALRTNAANSKSRSQLYKELKEARNKLKLLEKELENEKRLGLVSQKASNSPEFPTPPKDKETSAILISPITLASTSNTNMVDSETIDNVNMCITGSEVGSKMITSSNLDSIGK